MSFAAAPESMPPPNLRRPTRVGSGPPVRGSSFTELVTPKPVRGSGFTALVTPEPVRGSGFTTLLTPKPERVEADADAIDELGDEIATLAAHIHAGTHELLVLLARFDRMRGWEPGGHRTCAHWLAFRTGLDLGAAREHVRVARALEQLPHTSRAMAEGRLSFSKARALTRVADAETEADLLALAEGSTAAQLERVVRSWKTVTRTDEIDLERERHRSRTLSVFPDGDGMYAVSGRLDPEVGAVLMRAIEAAGDALYRKRASEDPLRPGPRAEREAARRRADAIGLLAERALAAGFGDGRDIDAGPRSDSDEPDAAKASRKPSFAEGRALAGERDARSAAPLSGSRAERYQVVLYIDEDTARGDSEPGRSELEDGTRVSAETSRRLACDASVVRVRQRADGADGVDGVDGSALDVGRRTRTIPPSLRRALESRDRGCRFPGCGLRFTEAHHVVHWADGGETSLSNTILLCRFHHRLLHEEGWGVEWWGAGRHPVFRDPHGHGHTSGRESDLASGLASGQMSGLAPGRGPPALRPGLAAQRLRHRNLRRGVSPDAWTASARWKREADIPDEVLFRATEAVL